MVAQWSVGNTYLMQDIIPLYYGYEKCDAKHRFGPAVRKEYLIHFCISGHGKFQSKNNVYELATGDFFIIKPDEITTYIADEYDPWEYSWIGFKGNIANVFDNMVTGRFPLDIGISLKLLSQNGNASPYTLSSLLMHLIGDVFNEKTNDVCIAENVKNYIELNYSTNIGIAKIANEFGYNRSHLYRLFKERMGISPKQYLTDFRLNQAKTLLKNGYSVKDTAYAVGFSDEFNFSKSFKQKFKASPQKYIGRGQ